jgi:hypothetical protein
MDRNYYFQNLANERQREISKELATRHILKEAKANTPAGIQRKQIELRVAPVVIGVSALFLVFFK